LTNSNNYKMKTKFSGILTLLLAFVVQLTFAQEKTVSGTVSDASGLPLPGATVLVKGTTSGTSTDFDGRYSIKANTGATLVFSFVGYTTQEIKVGTSSSINVALSEDAAVLEEVVVTAFGKTKQKRSLGYSATAVDAATLTEVTNSNNPFESLSGKVAGVDITAPAQPGASTKIILRGFSSLGSNSPLYVVDGTPISSAINGTNENSGNSSINRSFDGGSNINDLDPNSIESINILKGGPAAALYGSRASNGAIIITTKKGRNNEKLRVDVVSSVDFLEVARTPHMQNQFGQGWNGQNYSGGGTLAASNENGSWGAPFNGQTRLWGQVYNNSQQLKPYVALEDNIKDFYDIGNTYSNSVRLSGGGEKSDFSLIYSKTDTDGIVPTDSDALKKRTLGFNAGIGTERFKVRVSANYAQTRQNAINTGQGDNAGQGNTFTQELLQIPRDIPLISLKDYKNNPFSSSDYFYTPYATNPYFLLNENKTNITRERFYGNINLSYEISPKLTATWQWGTDIINGGRHSHGAIQNFTPGSPVANQGGTATVGGVTERTNQAKHYQTFGTLDYVTQLNENFGLEATLGATYRDISTSSLSVSITDLDIPNYYEISNSAVTPITVQTNALSRNYSTFGMLTLSYKDRIYLNLTGRNEWTSTLAIGNNSYFYPSANISAIAIEDGTNRVKLRAGYAQLANSAPLYRTASIAVQGVADASFGDILFPFGGVNSFEIGGRLGNAGIKPEFTDEFEIGLEAAFFNNRITADFTYYDKTTDGAIVDQNLPFSTGYSVITGNFIDIQNKGIEVALGFVPIQTEDFKWNLDYTFTKNKNEVLKLPEGVDKFLINGLGTINFYAIKGEPLGVFNSTVHSYNDAGQLIVNANTGYPVSTSEEQKIGTSQRDFVMGLKNTFKYKDFRLSFSMDWKQGGEMYVGSADLLMFTGNAINTTYNDRNPFIFPNSVIVDTPAVLDTNGTVITPATYAENTTPIGFEAITDVWNDTNISSVAAQHVVDKTFVRLRDLSFAYSFPSKLTEQMKLSDLTLSVYGRNLVLWTPDENPYVDPEVGTFGNDIGSEFGEFYANPAQRTYGISLKMSF
jgi:TonB-linked SusC/RagA family outer membrane protein